MLRQWSLLLPLALLCILGRSALARELHAEVADNMTARVASMHGLQEGDALMQRIRNITNRESWKFKYAFPQRQLGKGLTIVGDNSRMKNFMRKMINGTAVKYALLGGSISSGRGAPVRDLQWDTVMQKWFELTFTDCGIKFPKLSPRSHAPEWTDDFHACSSGSKAVSVTNLAIGSSSCIFAEKCLFDKIPEDVDLVILEYTMNALEPEQQSIISIERRSLERLMRRILLMPKAPALMLFHTTTGHLVKDRHPWGPHAEDWHNMLVSYYGNIQAVSVRNVLFELMEANHDQLAALRIWDVPPYGQLMHPEYTGVVLYSDIIINYWQRLAKQVMSEMLSEVLIPDTAIPDKVEEVKTYPPACPVHQLPVCHSPLSPIVVQYIKNLTDNPLRLPAPLIPGNWENSDGFCISGENLADVYEGHTGSWVMKDDAVEGIHHSKKWGYTGDNPGDTLTFKLDSTLNGHVLPKREGEHVVKETIQDNDGITLNVTDGLVEVLVGYLRTYENIGKAEVTCVQGCTCDRQLLDGLWEQKSSQPFYHRMYISPHPECHIQVSILPESSTSSHRFKVTGMVVSQRPFHYGTHHAANVMQAIDDMTHSIRLY